MRWKVQTSDGEYTVTAEHAAVNSNKVLMCEISEGQTDYQKGMVDAANYLKELMVQLDNVPVDLFAAIYPTLDRIIEENTPKKTEAEIFFEKHRGRVCRTKGGYEAALVDCNPPTLTLDATTFEYVTCEVEDITHVKEERWVEL